MKNEKYDVGDKLQLPVIAGTVSGGPVIVGMLVGVAETDRGTDGTAGVKVGTSVTTQSVTATGAIGVGAPVYITSTTYALTDAPGAGKQLYGHTITSSSGTGAKTHDIRVAHYAIAVGTPA